MQSLYARYNPFVKPAGKQSLTAWMRLEYLACNHPFANLDAISGQVLPDTPNIFALQ
jgi:hypothetical protein